MEVAGLNQVKLSQRRLFKAAEKEGWVGTAQGPRGLPVIPLKPLRERGSSKDTAWGTAARFWGSPKMGDSDAVSPGLVGDIW